MVEILVPDTFYLMGEIISKIPVNLLFKRGDNEWNTSKPSI